MVCTGNGFLHSGQRNSFLTRYFKYTKMKRNTKKLVMLTLGATLGALAGYAYWYYVGCISGSCSITSSPVNSSVYGSIMGALLVNTFQKTPRENKATL